MSQDRKAAWLAYAQAWKEETREAKQRLLQQSVAPNCVYTDPNTIQHGHDALSDYMLAYHQQVPGGWFDTFYFLTHHDVSIARWRAMTGDNKVLGEGISWGRFSEEDKLVAMTGFFEPQPS